MNLSRFIHEAEFQEFEDMIKQAMILDLTAYLTTRTLDCQKIEVPLNLWEHIKLAFYQKFPAKTRQLSQRFPVKWRNIMPQVYEAIDMPIDLGFGSVLFVEHPYHF